MKLVASIRGCAKSCAFSRVGWVLVIVHSVWFFAMLKAMGPPSRAAADFRDSFQGADWTLFAGRYFHFAYEPVIVKILLFLDLPGLLIALVLDICVSPIVAMAHLGTFAASYVSAGEFLVAGSLQWIVIGRWLEMRWQPKSASTP